MELWLCGYRNNSPIQLACPRSVGDTPQTRFCQLFQEEEMVHTLTVTIYIQQQILFPCLLSPSR